MSSFTCKEDGGGTRSTVRSLDKPHIFSGEANKTLCGLALGLCTLNTTASHHRSLVAFQHNHQNIVKMTAEAPPKYIYKIVPEAPAEPFPKEHPLSELDRNDGFIHLSTSTQVSLFL